MRRRAGFPTGSSVAGMTTRLALSRSRSHVHTIVDRAAVRQAGGRGEGSTAGTICAPRGVAQPGSALRSGRRGPQFKSGHPDRVGGEPGSENPGSPPMGHPGAGWRLSSGRASRCRLRRRLHAGPAGARSGAEGYRELGLRYGLDLDPALYEEARAAAFAEVKRHPELDHDEEIWVLFTERIIIGMGGRGDTYRAAVEMEQRWAHSAHFELYDDAVPALAAVRDAGPEGRAAVELVAEPRGVRRPSRARRRRRAHVACAREDEAARVDLPGGARAARRRGAAGGDGGRHAARGHRGRAGRRDEGGAARPRGAASGGSGAARGSPRARRRRSGFNRLRV